jgi:hypothetical protein
LPESSGGRFRGFPMSTSFHYSSPCLYITWGWKIAPSAAAVQRRSLTPLTGSSPYGAVSQKFVIFLLISDRSTLYTCIFYDRSQI